MNSERLSQLLELIRENDSDPFLFYAVGLEYQDTDVELALEYFNKVIENFPDYLPVFFTCANLLYEMEEFEEAIKIAEAGINLAGEQGNEKALQELKQLHTNISYDI